MESKHIIKNHVRFKGEFKKELKDEFPGRDLAEFIAEELRQKNCVVNSVEYTEPWFTVNVVSGSIEYPLMVSLSAMEEDYWEISCPRTLRFFARLRGKSEDTELQSLVNMLDEILQDEKTITDIKWYGDYDDLIDDYVKKPGEKGLSIVGKYLYKLFLPLCLTGWVLALIGGIRSGKESLLLHIGVIMFLLPIASYFGFIVISILWGVVDDIKESFQKKTKKRWFRWIFALFLVSLLVVPFFLGLLHNPSVDKVMPIIEKGFFRLAVLVFYCFLLLMFGSLFWGSFSRIFIPSYRKKRRKNEHFSLIGSFLILIGGTGFLLGFFACLGLLKWVPKTVEFPLADVESIDVNGEGRLFVASGFYNRIQVYNTKGDFIRGWFIPGDVGGGAIKMRINNANEVEIAALRGDKIEVIDENGKVLRFKQYGENDITFWDNFDHKGKHLINKSTERQYDVEGWILPKIIQIGPEGKKIIGKNIIYLFPFQGPFQGIVTAFIGGFFMARAEKKRKKR